MKEKFAQLMQNENLTAGKLAEMLEIQPAVISHLRAGRNKPSYDVIQKILRRFPHINPDWLLLDSEQMYRDEYDHTNNNEQESNNLFTSFGSAQSAKAADKPETDDAAKNSTSRESNISELMSNRPEISNSHKEAQIERIIAFYSDGTFQSFDKR